MKRILIVLPIALLLSAPVSATRPAILDSIEPLQWVSMSMIQVGPFSIPAGDLKIGVHCTTFQIGSNYHLTDFHCIGDTDTGEVLDRGYYVGPHQAKVVDWDWDNDMAILYTKEPNEHSLQLADSVEQFDYIETAGYSFGWKSPNWFQGHMGTIGLHEPRLADRAISVYVVTGAGGQSGSPVVDAKGNVVGIVQLSNDPSEFLPVLYGNTIELIKHFSEWAFNS